ncbi:hypothetical protein Patl1_29750 [Pistacia atlantica]|uniref:Uncharacterized protein n=1 Tax=Pistacia atlantica TaxID=434234 RepID=A0ACC1AC73_9ROSI|nr:hypothetical protein Patl1_29750 [Pistacia atlantica]
MSSNSNTIESLPHPNTNIHTLSQPVTEKLNGTNLMAWSIQFMVFLNSHDLVGYIDGTITAPAETIEDAPNPAYAIWFWKDNCVKSWILASISEKLVASLYGTRTTKQAWDSLQTRFASASRPRVALLKRQIQTLSQGNKTCSAYLDEAKAIAKQLAATGKPMDDQDLISHLLALLLSNRPLDILEDMLVKFVVRPIILLLIVMRDLTMPIKAKFLLLILQPWQTKQMRSLITSDMITVGNGTSLSIKNTGHSSLYLNQTPFHLNNVLHCPQASEPNPQNSVPRTG